MKVSEILVRNAGLDGNRTVRTIKQFFESGQATTPLGQLLVALVAETVWSDEYGVYADFGGYDKYKPFLRIYHPAFPGDRPVVIYEGPDATVDGVKEAVLAHIGKQLKDLQKQSTALQIKSASLNDAQKSIFRKTAQAAVVAKFPDAVGCRLFAPYGIKDLTCFIHGDGFGAGHIFVACGTCPEYAGGIVQIDMLGDEWYYMKSTEKYERFWTELARAFAAQELKVPKDDLYCQKTYVIKDFGLFHANTVLLRQRSVNGQVVVTFDVDSLPTKVVLMPDDEVQ